MSINSDFTDLLKDKDVRYILQRIHSKSNTCRADHSTIYAIVPSYSGRTELFNQDKPISNDEYFLQLLVNKEVINNLKFDSRDPKKRKDGIDDLLLNSAEEFKTPYIRVSFDILDDKFLKELCNTAADAFILNPYPLEEQKDIVLTTINIAKGHLKNENIILTWDEFDDLTDARRIQIVKILSNLHGVGLITLQKLNYNLLNILQGGRVEFQADLICKASTAFLSKLTLKYKSLVLDTHNEIAYSPRIDEWVGFDKRNGRKVLYEILEAFVRKELKNEVLTDIEIWKIIEPRGKKPKKLQSHRLNKVVEAVHHLNSKFKSTKDNRLIPRDEANGYYHLNP